VVNLENALAKNPHMRLFAGYGYYEAGQWFTSTGHQRTNTRPIWKSSSKLRCLTEAMPGVDSDTAL